MAYPKGTPVSAETRKKMSIAHKKTYENGRIPWFKGKHFSEEHRHKMGQSHRGKPSPTKGRTITQEHKDRISIANSAKNKAANPYSLDKNTSAYHDTLDAPRLA